MVIRQDYEGFARLIDSVDIALEGGHLLVAAIARI